MRDFIVTAVENANFAMQDAGLQTDHLTDEQIYDIMEGIGSSVVDAAMGRAVDPAALDCGDVDLGDVPPLGLERDPVNLGGFVEYKRLRHQPLRQLIGEGLRRSAYTASSEGLNSAPSK